MMRNAWNQQHWRRLEIETAQAVAAASSEALAVAAVARRARRVLQAFSSSFFIVTRFLPPAKRSQVELIYAAVRYPDEIVDTFTLPPARQLALLDAWAEGYECALLDDHLQSSVASGVPCFAAAFAQVVRANSIPPQHYRDFLAAMRLDVAPRPYRTLDDLIDSYIYGSAIVVGYFLAYVYGPNAPGDLERALQASRDLGIALQLTNFLRDVREDQRRGRVYLPVDMLQAAGVDTANPAVAQLNTVLRRLSQVAEQHYAATEANLDAFAADSRVAIQACIDVYRQLNQRIGRSAAGILHRESVPLTHKFRVLPSSKYWRLPLAYLGGI